MIAAFAAIGAAGLGAVVALLVQARTTKAARRERLTLTAVDLLAAGHEALSLAGWVRSGRVTIGGGTDPTKTDPYLGSRSAFGRASYMLSLLTDDQQVLSAVARLDTAFMLMIVNSLPALADDEDEWRATVADFRARQDEVVSAVRADAGRKKLAA